MGVGGQRRFNLRERDPVTEICAFLEEYEVSCGNYLPTFRDNVSVPFHRSRVRVGRAQIPLTLRRKPEIKVRHGTYFTGGCVGPSAVWTGAENLGPTGIRSLDRPARHAGNNNNNNNNIQYS
jgi:hypothetical protein